MKIALVSAYDLAFPGGVGEHIMHLADHLQRLGHLVQIIAPWSGQGDLQPEPVIHRIGTVVPVPVNGSVARITLSPTVDQRVRAILRAERFDIIHLHEPLMPVLPLTVLRHSHAVNVGTFHAYRPSHLAYLYGKPILHPFFQRLHGRIAVSSAARDFVGQYFDADYAIIPNGIELARFNQVDAPLPVREADRPTILFVGRFDEPRKGFRYLLRALPLVRRVYPTVRLVVVGRGEADQYQHLLGSQWQNQVIFAGCVSREALPRYYAGCDIFCSPAIGRESFGLVLLEAMASGRPIVASNIRGYAGVMTHEHEGLLVEPKNAEALAAGLLRLLNDQRLRQQLGERGRRTAAAHDWQEVSRRVVRYYREVAVPECRSAQGIR